MNIQYSDTSWFIFYFIYLLISQAGNTALHGAVKNGHTSTVQLLMSSDCRVNVRNEQGLTPMEIASRDHNNDIIAQLSGLKVGIGY